MLFQNPRLQPVDSGTSLFCKERREQQAAAHGGSLSHRPEEPTASLAGHTDTGPQFHSNSRGCQGLHHTKVNKILEAGSNACIRVSTLYFPLFIFFISNLNLSPLFQLSIPLLYSVPLFLPPNTLFLFFISSLYFSTP